MLTLCSVIDIDSTEREGGTGNARDPLCLEGSIAEQTPDKRRGPFQMLTGCRANSAQIW
jgi:hypothetical protein